MAALDPLKRDAFLSDLQSAQTAVRQGVVALRTASANTHWSIWEKYCASICLDPTLQGIQDPIPILQVFAHRYRHGALSPSRHPVRSRTVEDALRSIGQAFTHVGAKDPRHKDGHLDFRLKRMFSCYAKFDPPPNRVKPIPVQILQFASEQTRQAPNPSNVAINDMLTLAFFFLLRPGEYTGNTTTNNHPFRLCDVQLHTGTTRHNSLTTPVTTLQTATFVTLEFTTQKNGVRGEVIGLGKSGHPYFCPVLAMVRRMTHLRAHTASPNIPLSTYWRAAQQHRVTPADISDALRCATTLLGPRYGFLAKDISARSLRASGAMALLCAKVDTDIIRLMGRWRSDEMLRYLHVQAAPIMANFASTMVLQGNFCLHPNQEVPMH